ncbi:MAG TPA: hypothetical protein DIT33_14305 [Pseudomonas sp.]|nr:hypothetical protein [Pseudomonas sp.]
MIEDSTADVIVHCGPVPEAKVGDLLRLYWTGIDGIPRLVGTTPINNLENFISLRITTDVALQAGEGMSTLHYAWVDAFDVENPSSELIFEIKTTVPGDPHRSGNDAGTPDINELLAAPIVDPLELYLDDTATVTIAPWVNMFAGDVLTLKWGEYKIPHLPLLAGDIGKSIVFNLTAADIEAGANSDAVQVRYEIRDRVRNWSQNSLATLVKVDTDLDLLDPPDVIDVVSSVDGNKLNYDDLGGGDSVVMVNTPAPVFTPGDTITLYWKGSNAQGASIERSYELPVSTNRLRFNVPNADVQLFIGGEITSVYYTLTKQADGSVQPSRSQMFIVIGTQLDLPAPILENGLVGGIFEPATLPSTGASISLEAYPGMDEGDRIFLSWVGTSHEGDELRGSEELEVERSDVGLTFYFTIDKDEFSPLGDGTEVTFRYTVIFADSGRTRNSLFAFYDVTNVATGFLERPEVLEATTDDVLDPSDPLFTKAHIQIPDDVLLLVGDRIDLLWDSPLVTGDTTDYINIKTNGKGVPFEVPKAIVETSLHMDVLVSYTLTRGGTKRYDSRVLSLFIGSADDKLLPPPVVTEADKTFNTLDPDDVTTPYAHVVIKATDVNVAVDDQVVLNWAGSNPGGSYAYTEDISGSEAGKAVTFDVPKAFVDANLGGTITVEYTVIRALGGSRQPSHPLVLMVEQVAAVAPVITSIKDSKDVEIAEGGSTTDSSVTVAGTALASSEVELFNGLTSRGTATTDTTGAWKHLLTGLVTGDYSVTAKALYGTGQVSGPRTFSVAAQIVPAITSVKSASNVEIPNGGTTSDTSVTVTGTALASSQVEIFDGAITKGPVSVSATGVWTLPLTGLAVTSHSLTAKALYGTNPVSAAWAFNVVAVTPELTIDTTSVALNGSILIFEHGRLEAAYDASTSITRVAHGGTPPYTYSSSNPDIAPVDASTGYVKALSNGQTTITVRDAGGQSKSYSVSVTGVTHIAYLGIANWPGANNGAAGRGGRLPSVAQLGDIYRAFGGSRFPYSGSIWSSELAGSIPPSYWMRDLQTGVTGKGLMNFPTRHSIYLYT